MISARPSGFGLVMFIMETQDCSEHQVRGRCKYSYRRPRVSNRRQSQRKAPPFPKHASHSLGHGLPLLPIVRSTAPPRTGRCSCKFSGTVCVASGLGCWRLSLLGTDTLQFSAPFFPPEKGRTTVNGKMSRFRASLPCGITCLSDCEQRIAPCSDSDGVWQVAFLE